MYGTTFLCCFRKLRPKIGVFHYFSTTLHNSLQQATKRVGSPTSQRIITVLLFRAPFLVFLYFLQRKVTVSLHPQMEHQLHLMDVWVQWLTSDTWPDSYLFSSLLFFRKQPLLFGRNKTIYAFQSQIKSTNNIVTVDCSEYFWGRWFSTIYDWHPSKSRSFKVELLESFHRSFKSVFLLLD